MISDPAEVPPNLKRRILDLVVLWQAVTLGGILIVCLLIIWHLKRRGMIVRNRIKPPVIRPDLPVQVDDIPQES